MTIVTLSSGHSRHVRGASEFLDEVVEARKVVDEVGKLYRGEKIYTFHDNTSNTQDENLETVISWHNSITCDLATSIHFNAYEITDQPRGTECLYLTQKDIAGAMSAAIADAGGFIDRGAKYRDDLAFLNQTEMPAILIEVCFVDSSKDTSLYEIYFHAICRAIATVIAGASPA
jgi:N-acetylmuramoyl-L-alanine amidase